MRKEEEKNFFGTKYVHIADIKSITNLRKGGVTVVYELEELKHALKEGKQLKKTIPHNEVTCYAFPIPFPVNRLNGEPMVNPFGITMTLPQKSRQICVPINVVSPNGDVKNWGYDCEPEGGDSITLPSGTPHINNCLLSFNQGRINCGGICPRGSCGLIFNIVEIESSSFVRFIAMGCSCTTT